MNEVKVTVIWLLKMIKKIFNLFGKIGINPKKYQKKQIWIETEFHRWLLKSSTHYQRLFSLILLCLITASCSPGNSQLESTPKMTAINSVTPEKNLTCTPTQTETPIPSPTHTQKSTQTIENTENPTRIPTSEDYWVRGYDIDITFSQEEGWCSSLSVEEAIIIDYDLDGDEIVLDVEMLLYERSMREKIRAKSFEFSEYDATSQSFSKPEIFSPENFSDLNLKFDTIGPNTRYQVEMLLEGCKDFSDDFVVDYVSGYVNPNFILVQIVQYEKTW